MVSFVIVCGVCVEVICDSVERWILEVWKMWYFKFVLNGRSLFGCNVILRGIDGIEYYSISLGNMYFF